MSEVAKFFWNSRNAKNYPVMLGFSNGRESWGPGYTQRELIGKSMRDKGWIPEEGAILDLGAGPCTKFIFGSEIASERVWAVDFSPTLLEKSGVPEERRTVDDLTTMRFPREWKNKFDLATAVLLFRYLTLQERKELILKVKNALTVNGRIVIIDFETMRQDEISEEIGEAEQFGLHETCSQLKDAGLGDVESGKFNYLFEDGAGDPAPLSVGWVTAVKR